MFSFRAVIALLWMAITPALWACNSGTVRDAAFQSRRDLYMLAVFGPEKDGKTDTIAADLEKWLLPQSDLLNIRIERVHTDSPEVDWKRYGLKKSPELLPTVALIGRFSLLQESYCLKQWHPKPASEALERLGTSPALEAAKEHLVHVWGVLLFSPSPDEPDPAVKATLEAVEKRWDKEHAPGIRMVTLDRTDPKEAILCKLAGLDEDSLDWVCVLFGRGKLLLPPLEGEDISAQRLEQLLNQLTVPCTCIQDTTTTGLDLPLRWEKTLDERFALLEKAAGGYQELSLGNQIDTKIDQLFPESSSAKQRIRFLLALVPTFLLALGAIGITLFKLWRFPKKDTPPPEE